MSKQRRQILSAAATVTLVLGLGGGSASAQTYGGGASTTTFGTAVASNQCIITVADQNNAHQPQGGPKEDQAPTNCNHAYQGTP